jgi:hypothetical protein
MMHMGEMFPDMAPPFAVSLLFRLFTLTLPTVKPLSVPPATESSPFTAKKST